MPGAITKGLLARNAIHKDPIADAMQVARKTAFQRSLPSLPKLDINVRMHTIPFRKC